MSLKTLEKSLLVLEAFTKDCPKWKLRELSRELNLNHSIVYRILSTLEKGGYIYQNETSKEYELGLKFLEMGSVIDNNLKISEMLEPIMQSLTEKTKESVVFTILDNYDGLFFKITESQQNIRFAESVGRRSPLYIGASHRVMLAYLPETVQRVVYKKAVEANQKTDAERSLFFQRLSDIRRQGWLYSSGETFPDVSAISVPIFDSQHRIIASLSIAGPNYRLSEEAAREKITPLMDCKNRVQNFTSKLSFPVTRPAAVSSDNKEIM